MTAYVIGHITVKDAEKWAEYRSRVPATLEPWRAEVVLRGRKVGFDLLTELLLVSAASDP